MQGDEAEGRTVNTYWTTDEIILAYDLLRENGGKPLKKTDPRIIKLSTFLRTHSGHPLNTRPENFRSPSSVRHKINDITSSRPGYPGLTKKGGTVTELVAEEFDQDMERLRISAAMIRSELQSGRLLPVAEELDEDDEFKGAEGGLLFARHQRRERSKKLRSDKILEAKREGRPIACEVCSFDFALVYGERGRDYIEVHHVMPLHESGPVITSLRDLALLCSNCHRIIHRGNPWLTPQQLKALVQIQAAEQPTQSLADTSEATSSGTAKAL